MASYIAKKRFTGPSGKVYQPGDLCPEALKVRRLRAWISYGWLEEVHGSKPQAAAAPEPAKEPAPVAVEVEKEETQTFKRRRGRPRKDES